MKKFFDKNLFRILLFSFLFLSFSGSKALGIEFYTIISNCEIHTGLIVSVDKENLRFVNLTGKLERIPVQSINSIFIYNTLENPIASLSIDSELCALLRDVYIKEDKTPLFTGLAVSFIDELIIFFDISGKTHVLNLYDISKIRPFEIKENSIRKIESYKQVEFNISTFLTACPDIIKNTKGGIYPTKILTDKIRISEFLLKYENGFNRLESYQERTYYYAKPFLYEQRTRFGNYVMVKDGSFGANTFNPYFQWSNGEAYRFQSLTVLGTSIPDMLPNLDPIWTFSSDIKSHFFNTMFIGNLDLGALPAGSQYYYAEESDLDSSQKISVATSLNYMLLLGADYGQFSFSVGTFFPIFGIRIKDERREVLASGSSPTVKFMYTKDNLRLRVIASYNDYKQNGGDSEDYVNVLLKDGEEYPYELTKFRFRYGYTRFGFDYDLTKMLKFGFSGVIIYGKYRETILNSNNHMDFSQYNSSVYIHQTVGHYVAVKGIFNYYIMRYDYKMFDNNDKGYTGYYHYGGAFELLF